MKTLKELEEVATEATKMVSLMARIVPEEQKKEAYHALVCLYQDVVTHSQDYLATERSHGHLEQVALQAHYHKWQDKVKQSERRHQQWSQKPLMGYCLKPVAYVQLKRRTKKLRAIEGEWQQTVAWQCKLGSLYQQISDNVMEIGETLSAFERRLERKLAGQLNREWWTFYGSWCGCYSVEFGEPFHDYVKKLFAIERELKIEGWGAWGVTLYLTRLKEQMEDGTTEELLSYQVSQSQEAHLVGSELYTAMYQADGRGQEPKSQVQAVIRQLGGYLDSFGMLQLAGRFQLDLRLAPDSLFLETYAAKVRQAYPHGLLPKAYDLVEEEDEYQMIKAIHQFRMYLDRQNIFYIRANFQGATDYHKLLAFEEACIGQRGDAGRLDYRSNSAFHNRTSQHLPFFGQHNDKIKSHNGLSEFIVNVQDGSFATQWDVLRTVDGQSFFIWEGNQVVGLRACLVDSRPTDYDLSGLNGKEIVDTESFNYSAKDDRKVADSSHTLLDVAPANGKLGLEHDIKLQAKKTWKSQSVTTYGNQGRDKYTETHQIKLQEDSFL